MTTVVWREWFSPEAVKYLTEIGTLSREVDEVELGPGDDGASVAEAIVEAVHNDGDDEWFREGGRIVILEPPELAGTYRIHVDYDPTYTAYRENDTSDG